MNETANQSVLLILGVGGEPYEFVVPLLIAAVFLIMWLAILIFIFRDRRRQKRLRLGQCIVCGYDLSGTAKDAPCPECGRRA